MKLKLDGTTFIQKVVLYNRFYTDWFNADGYCVQSRENYKGCLSKVDNIEVSVYNRGTKIKSCGTLQRKTGLKQSDQIYTVPCNTKGDTVKVTQEDPNKVLVIFEIAITGKGEKSILFSHTEIAYLLFASINTEFNFYQKQNKSTTVD